ncbi:MAG: CPBP family intramembrane metalloprotease [Ferruginibacter sp.]|nr:CPBP family intramembrane metalloprotease [Chitinophagaceae bacterium]
MSMINKRSNRLDTDLTIKEESGINRPPGDSFATSLRGFGPVGILAIVVIIIAGNVSFGRIVAPVGAILVLLWVRWSHTPWQEIGYIRPKSWIGSLALGVLFGILFKLIMKAVVMPLLGADPINQAYHYLAGNTSMLPVAIWAMLVAGFGEETVFRGWMFERLGKLTGHTKWAKILIVVITSLVFGWGHYFNQGFPGVQHAFIVGLVFGSVFAVTGRIFMLMVAHAAFDLTALAIIYWDMEYDVAHFIFK